MNFGLIIWWFANKPFYCRKAYFLVLLKYKNLFYFEANEKLKIENIKNSTFYVLAIRKEIIDNISDKYYIDLSNISVISNSFFTYIQDIVKTKPGITGYWQTSGRSDTTFEKRLELEEYYSKNE